MSHGDSITKLPPGFIIAGSTENTRIAAIYHRNHKLFGLQFHPEVRHTPNGTTMLERLIDRQAVDAARGVRP